MEHSKECLAFIKEQEAKRDAQVDAEIKALKEAGVDISRRGWGYQYKCICKTQETQ